MIMKRGWSMFLVLLLLLGCRSSRHTLPRTVTEQAAPDERALLIDSILQTGLDREAVYTLLGRIKPMSSLKLYRMPLANTDSAKRSSPEIVDRAKKGRYLDRLSHVQKAINAIRLPDLAFVFIPYRAHQDSNRTIQLSVVRVSLLDSLLKAKESFFGQYGLVPGADPATVVSTIENAGIYERYRGYGYLFGYPDYAVDFFVEASHTRRDIQKPTPRNFFNIPTHQSKEGYFVYAYPKDYEPSREVDSLLYHRSMQVLERYEKLRDRYLNADSTVRAYRLLLDAVAAEEHLK